MIKLQELLRKTFDEYPTIRAIIKLQYIPYQESNYYSGIKSIVINNLPKILEKGTWYENP